MAQEEFLNPQKVLEEINLSDDLIACDLGCGSGGWTIPLAKILNNGMVYAIDILEEVVSALTGKIARENILNIKVMRGDVEKGAGLTDRSVDFVLLSNLLFQVDDQKFVLKEANRILRDNGLVLIVDWKENAPLGPRQDAISFEGTKLTARDLGFKIEKEFDAGKYHRAILLKKA